MADLPLFPFTTQEDWYGELVFLSADAAEQEISLAGRTFEMPVTPATQGGALVEPVRTLTMDAGGGLSLKDGSPNTLVFRVSRDTARGFARGEFTADVLEVVSGERHLFMPVRIRYSEPSGILSFISRFVGIKVSFSARLQPIVSPVAITGRQGAAGATIINGTAPPVPADGKNGDFFIEDRTASSRGRRMYGPKAGGAWPPSPWTIQVAGFEDVPGLSTALANTATRYNTVALATAASIPTSVQAIDVAGFSAAGVGAGRYTRSGTTGAGTGRFQTADGAWWQLARDAILSLEQFGAGGGNAGADAAAIQGALRFSKVARLGTALQQVEINDLASYMALTVKDDGSGKADTPGLYGKYVIPAQARDAGMGHAGDLIAGLHCPVSSQCASAVEVLVGDSISTYAANTYFRSNMLAMALEREIRAQAGNKPVAFYDRAIGGKTLNEFFSDTLKRPERPPWWLADVPGTRWVDLVKTLQPARPTRLWVSFGMNDSSLVSIADLRTLVAIVRGWDFPCDIVLLTTLVPRANVNASFPTWNTIAEQEGRHNAAGLVRTFARYMGLGLVDMNRQMLRAVHGYDPVETFLTKQGSYTAAGNGFAGDRQCTDYKVTFNLDTAQIPADNGTPIGFSTGPGTEDVIYLTRTVGTNAYFLTCYTGNAGDNWAYVVNAPVTITPDNGTQIRLCFERYGNLACLYKDGTAAEAYGEFLPHLWSGKIMARGGRYVPSLSCSKAGAILSAGFDYGMPALCNPSLSVDDLYGEFPPVFSPGGSGYRGGVGWNHPGSLVDAHIYGPVLRNCQMFAGDPLVRSFPTTMSVRGATGQTRRFLFDDDGITARDGNVTAYGFFRTAGGIRLDLTNPAPRVTPSGQGITMAAGGATDSAYFIFGANGVLSTANGGISAGGTIAHAADNVWSFGTPALRATAVYAASGTINTSDSREKLNRDGGELVEDKVSPLTAAEIAWGVALGDEMGVYVWRAAYAEKGEDARLHVGMTVQRAIALAQEHGLDPFRYGFICHDVWDAVEPQDALIENIETGKDEVGEPILQPILVSPATPGHPAGERYGFRYDELKLFIDAAERSARRAGAEAANV